MPSGASSPEMEQAFVSIGKNHDLQKSFLKALHPEDNQPRALAIFLSVASTHPDKSKNTHHWPPPMQSYSINLSRGTGHTIKCPRRTLWFLSLRHPELCRHGQGSLLAQARIRSESIVGDRTQVRDRPPSDDERTRVGERKRIFPSLGFRQDLLIDPIRSSSSQCIGFQLASWEIFPRVYPFQRGICVDQAYFSSMVGKAKGIPP